MAEENRTRTRNMVIRLSDKEREMLEDVAVHEELSASETIRWLVRREHERIEPKAKPRKGAKQ
jgi:hypothetical protein